MKPYPVLTICLLFILSGVTSCGLFKQKPIELFEYHHMLGYRDNTSEAIAYYIYCYRNNNPFAKDTLFYRLRLEAGLYDNPFSEISRIYNYYFPITQSGVLGLNPTKHDSLWAFLPDSSERLPLYNYEVEGSTICFHYMSNKERIEDLQHQMYDRSIYTSYPGNEKWSYMKIYYFVYKYLNGRDTLHNSLPDSLLALDAIPMGYFPLDTNVYVRGQLVKKRLGFEMSSPIDSIQNIRLAEADSFLLSLPVKLFQKAYYETQKLDCLDGKTFPINRHR